MKFFQLYIILLNTLLQLVLWYVRAHTESDFKYINTHM